MKKRGNAMSYLKLLGLVRGEAKSGFTATAGYYWK